LHPLNAAARGHLNNESLDSLLAANRDTGADKCPNEPARHDDLSRQKQRLQVGFY
jgi:hypothetical protein